jgi:alginate O-acetyltransferase complex protein AlgI
VAEIYLYFCYYRNLAECMLFNSLDFALFLPYCLLIYHLIPAGKLRWRAAFLLIMSLVFYGWWDIRFLVLLGIATVMDYFCAIAMEDSSSPRIRKLFIGISVAGNLGMLIYFKYANFFLESFVEAFRFLGKAPELVHLDIVLPVGISFYTFQTLSYTIDVYKGNLKASRSLIYFGAFVSFFPQLVAGPIERASHLLGQFEEEKKVSREEWSEGCKQILWGFFKKLVVADNCAALANPIFENPGNQAGSTLFLGAIFFAFQIYGDFSGYSDIAIGTARLFGFRLMQNFAFPYFSRDIAEFWRRWHISLSTWFRDYLYIPLGGSRGKLSHKIRNTSLVFLVSGFWHGANWTFLIWGSLHALFFLALLLGNRNRHNLDFSEKTSLKEVMQMMLTFLLVCLAWVFFRSPDTTFAFHYLKGIFSSSLFSLPSISSLKPLFAIVFLLMLEWKGKRHKFPLESHAFSEMPGLRMALYFLLFASIYFMGYTKSAIEFIYFQF